MSTTLLDGNVLVALAVADHVHRDAAVGWVRRRDWPFDTSPITQGTLVRPRRVGRGTPTGYL